jgi:hypothetical protein
MIFYRARFYDPQIGRFTSEDPIGFRGGDVNLYGYVWNNPQHFKDPFGLDGEPAGEPLTHLSNYQGALDYTSASFFWDGSNRIWYHQVVSQINTSDELAASLARLRLQDKTRARLSPFGRAFTANEIEKRQFSRLPLGLFRRQGSAAISNVGVDKVGNGFRWAGRAGLLISAAISVYRIASAAPCDRGRVFAEEIGGFAGALAVGWVGAQAGALIGTAIGGPIGGGVGALVGGIVGGIYGYQYGSSAGAEYYRALGGRDCSCSATGIP